MSIYKVKRITLFVVIVMSLLKVGLVWPEDEKIPRIVVAGDSLYLDGKKFFIKGVGYSPFRPDQYPGAPISMEIVEADFKRIKEAGFNTLRVWDMMPEEQLNLAEKYGLKVIQAAYLNPSADFNYSGFKRMAESKVRQMCRISKNHPNVIMYLLMNEPHAQAIADSGIENTINMYKELIAIVRQEDPYRPVSMANADWTIWFDQSMWDIVSFNAYSYAPSLVSYIGYANFIKSLKSLHSKDKPFLITEYGLSVSPEGSGGGGYGGNTEGEQVNAVVDSFRGLVEGGAIGGCVFEWNDEWWKSGNAGVHDDGPEEWFGIIAIKDKKNPLGTPRPAYYGLKSEMKLIVTKPVEGYRMWGNVDIEVNASDDVEEVMYRIDNGQWTNLIKSHDWWRGAFDSSNLEPGLHLLTVKGIEDDTREIPHNIIREINIIKCRNEEDISPPVNIKLTTDKPAYKNGDILKIKAQLIDKNGVPIGNHYIRLSAFNSIDSYNRNWEGQTDEKGFFLKSLPVLGSLEKWYYVYWVGTEIEEYGYRKKHSMVDYVKADIGEGFPIKWFSAKKAGRINIDGIIEKEWLKTEKIAITPDTNFTEGDVKDSDDLSAEVRVLWDEKNIYLLAHVKDDVPKRNKYEKTELWKDDCIELFISVDPTKIPEKRYSSSDFQILIGTNEKLWTFGQARGGIRNSEPLLSRAKVKRNETGYILEAVINSSNFQKKPLIKFKEGDVLGFDIAIGDSDEAAIRKSKLIWNGTGNGYKDSAVWGRLKLE